MFWTDLQPQKRTRNKNIKWYFSDKQHAQHPKTAAPAVPKIKTHIFAKSTTVVLFFFLLLFFRASRLDSFCMRFQLTYISWERVIFSARRRRKKIWSPNSGRGRRSSWYKFLESVLCFEPAAGGKRISGPNSGCVIRFQMI